MSETLRQIVICILLLIFGAFTLLTLIICFPLFVFTSAISFLITSTRLSIDVYRNRSKLHELKEVFSPIRNSSVCVVERSEDVVLAKDN